MADAAHDPIVIVGMARTAIGGFQGAFAPLTAPQLGSAAIEAAVSSAGLKAKDVSEVLMGCVLPAGQGQAPARQAALGAGLRSRACTTVNKMCGSGMKTVMLAYDGLHARAKDIVVAGGMESMTTRGVAALCIGGGEATAVAVERPDVRTIHTEVAIGAPAARVWGDFGGFRRLGAAGICWRGSRGRLGIGERLEVEISLPDKSPMTFRTTDREARAGPRALLAGHARDARGVRRRAWLPRRPWGCRPLPLRAVRELPRPAGCPDPVEDRGDDPHRLPGHEPAPSRPRPRPGSRA